MAKNPADQNSKRKACFIPNMSNFEVSLSYEGLKLRKSSERKSIAALKLKYAR